MDEIHVTAADRREFRRLRDKVDNLRGPGVKNTHNAIVIAAAAAVDGRVLPPPPSPVRWGKVKTAWTAGDVAVTLTPCQPDGTTATPAPDPVSVHVFGGGKAPAMLSAAVGDVLPWVYCGAGSGNTSGGSTAGGGGTGGAGTTNASSGSPTSVNGVLLSPPVLTIPVGAIYQALQLAGPSGAALWDDVRITE